jgi:integrase
MSHAFQKRDKNGRACKTVYIGYKDRNGSYVQEATKALTLTEGRRLAQEIERREERIRLGLDEPPPPDRTLSDVMDDYLATDATFLSSVDTIRARAERIRLEMGDVLLRNIRAPHITAMLARMAGALKPQTVAHHRTLMGTFLEHAIKLGWLRGPTPIADVPTIKIPTPKVTIIEPTDVAAVVEGFTSWWRPLCATAVFTGARKGELIGVRRESVNLRLWTLTIESSYDGPTKSARPRVVPIPPELRPHLERALATSKKLGSEFLFPTRKGRMATRNLDLAGMTKRALVRAGIIDHWDLRCRRKGCGFVERRMERADGVTCPKCQMRLWPKAIAPRSICFKTLRDVRYGRVRGRRRHRLRQGRPRSCEPEDHRETLHRRPGGAAP